MKKIIITVCTLLFLCGCGPKLIYPNLDWLIPWYVSDYISLDREQRSLLEERLVTFLSWHCRTQLPDYADTLRHMAETLADPEDSASGEIFNAYYHKFMAHWRELMIRIGPDLVDILSTASDEQVKELFTNLSEQNKKFKAEYVDISPQQSDENRQKRMIKRLSDWISRLTPEQKQAVADWSHSLKPIAAEWFQDRQSRVYAFGRLIEQRKTATNFRETFIDRLVYPERLRSEGYQMKIQYNTRKTLQFLVKLNDLLTAGQRSALVDRIRSLSDDFEKLSCESGISNSQ